MSRPPTGPSRPGARVRALAGRVHDSQQWDDARRYLPVYRWAGDLDDKTITSVVGGTWAIWAVGGFVTCTAGVPGAPLVGALLAAVGAVCSWALVSWWMGYRRSPARLRHQILAREQIAAAREIAESSLAATRVLELGEQVRPALAAGIRPGTAPRVLTAAGPDRRVVDVPRGQLPGCSAIDEQQGRW
ncbi:hypothetical protein AGMMS50218_15150 [Actinomycetota bacterium]|nr:hypothetical protein AGMMS50218_15150 [Actinomycetota bacterium]